MRTLDYDPTDVGLSAPPNAPEPPARGVPHSCRNGWTGDDDHPGPCPTCKPHLIRRSHGWAVRRSA